MAKKILNNINFLIVHLSVAASILYVHLTDYKVLGDCSVSLEENAMEGIELSEKGIIHCSSTHLAD